MSIDRATAAFDKIRPQLEQDLLAFLRFQTISAQPDHAPDLVACANWLCDQMLAAGLHAEVLCTNGHPAVFADTGPVADANAPTFLVYGHYDVQPIGDANSWKSPAFEPTLRDGAIFARGSADDKGQVWVHVAAARALHEAGLPFPVRVKYIIEGEEESGSKSLPGLLREHRDRLACDYVLISDTSKYDVDTPSLTQATRGIIGKEIIVEGPDHDLHSGVFGGTVANPANILARIVAALHDDQNRVTVPGFYDDVKTLTVEERKALLETDLSDAQLLAATGSVAPHGEAGFTTAERRGTRPTLDVNGIFGGYTGKGSSTIIPSKATAKITMRMVPNQDPSKISAAFDEYVRKLCPPSVRLQISGGQGGCPAYVAPLDSPAMKVARQALAEGYGKAPAILREGGSLPILPLLKEIFGADSIMLGFADANCNLHSPNEFFHLRDFRLGTLCVVRFLQMMGEKS